MSRQWSTINRYFVLTLVIAAAVWFAVAASSLMGALLIAGHYEIPEVCLYFCNKLMRGNRSAKLDATGLDAFRSENLAELNRLCGKVIVNELTQEQRDVMLAEIQRDELNAENKAYKKIEKGGLIDMAAEDGIQNVE